MLVGVNHGWRAQMEWLRFTERGFNRAESSLIFAIALELISKHPRTQHICLVGMYRRIFLHL